MSITESFCDPGLRGRVVVVTGGNSGIGAAIVRAFASVGARCVIHYLAEDVQGATGVTVLHEVPGRSAAETLVAEIASSGGEAIAVSADLADPAAPAAVFAAAEEAFGRVDVLVNNAAHCEAPDTITSVAPGTLDRHFAVNARAATLLMREFITRFSARDLRAGRIINISTDAARAFATQIAYGASKLALEGLTRSVAVEAGPLGITVNAVAPGPIQTGWITAELEAEVLRSIPLRRVGTPHDVAAAVLFLASEQAGWITGQVIQVAGGHAL